MDIYEMMVRNPNSRVIVKNGKIFFVSEMRIYEIVNNAYMEVKVF